MKKLFSYFAASCLMALASLAQAAEFSAEMLQLHDKEPAMSGKVAIKDSRMRMETSMQGQTHVSIIDPSAKKVLLLLPAMKSYMEMQFDASKAGPGAALLGKPDPEIGQWRTVGTETVDGWECEKRVMDFKDKSKGELTAWFAVKLDAPIKFVQTGKGGTFTIEYKNIKTGAVDAAQFAVPAGYQKMGMPAMPNAGMQ